MAYGTQYEDTVAKIYKQLMAAEGKEVTLHEIGFVAWPDHPTLLGSSVDRIVECDGEFWCLEIKTCLKDRTFPPIDHKMQMMTHCIAFGLERCDYVCYSRDTRRFYIASVRVPLTTPAFLDFRERILLPKLIDFQMRVKTRNMSAPRLKKHDKEEMLKELSKVVFIT